MPGPSSSSCSVVGESRSAAAAEGFAGEPVETEEMAPRWFDVDADAPTADYWRRFPTAPIDAVWEHTRPRPSEGEAEVNEATPDAEISSVPIVNIPAGTSLKFPTEMDHPGCVPPPPLLLLSADDKGD